MFYIEVGLGTSAVKLLLMDGGGRIHKVVLREYSLYSPYPARLEQNPEDQFTVSMDGMKELTSERDKSQVAGIGFGDQIHGLVTLDQADEATHLVILWNDGRFEKEIDYLNQIIGKEKLSAYTANITFTGFMAPKILRMRRNEPENLACICRIMLSKDYLVYRLLDSFCTDYSGVSGMLLLDAAHKCWFEEMMELCGITRKQLPDLYESYEIVGNLKEELAKELGSSQDIKITAGAGDNAVAAVGIGTVGEGCCNTFLGTSGTILIFSESFKVDCNNALHSFDHVGGHFHLMGCMLSAASCNRWWVEEILKTKEFSREQEEVVKLGESHMFYLPYLIGERFPHNDPRARVRFIGMTMDTSREEMTQAVLEGAVYGPRGSLEVARSLDIRIDRTKICGGGVKSPLWKKMVTSIMNVKVDMVESEEGPALGDAILVAVGRKEYPDVKTAADSTVKVTETIEPDGELTEKYEKQHSEFRQMYLAPKAIFQNLGGQCELGAGRSRFRYIMVGCTGTSETRLPFSQPGRASHPLCVPGSHLLFIRGAAVSHLPEGEEETRIRGSSVENIKEPALMAWNVLIFIIWINHTLREQEG